MEDDGCMRPRGWFRLTLTRYHSGTSLSLCSKPVPSSIVLKDIYTILWVEPSDS